jgi:hypothetical protein
MRFYLGTHQPAWLGRDLDVPLLVSHRRLAGRRSLPRARVPFAIDSGGFSELSLYGRWRADERSYIAALRRYATEIGRFDWAAPMDWMTESQVLARTGLSLRTHQQRTVANYLRLRDFAPELPIIAVLQGDTVTSSHRCADLYEQAGVDLAALPLLGVGSICRRQHSAEMEQILRSLAARGYRLHAFGAKVLGLGRYADAISSSDSLAWSFAGRYVSGCTPSHRTESNCLRFALSWHARLLDTLRADAPERVDGRRPQGRPTTRHRNRTRARDAKTTRARPRSVPARHPRQVALPQAKPERCRVDPRLGRRSGR